MSDTLFSFTPPFFLPLCYWLWQEGQDETWGSHRHCCGCWYILTHTPISFGKKCYMLCVVQRSSTRAKWKGTFSLPAEALDISVHIVSEIQSPVRQSPKTEPPRLIQMGNFEPPPLEPVVWKSQRPWAVWWPSSFRTREGVVDGKKSCTQLPQASFVTLLIQTQPQ